MNYGIINAFGLDVVDIRLHQPRITKMSRWSASIIFNHIKAKRRPETYLDWIGLTDNDELVFNRIVNVNCLLGVFV